jgi:hypothetical protein
MRNHPFDATARALASGAPRRRVLGGLVALAVGGLLEAVTGRKAFARGRGSVPEPRAASFLYVQTATSGGTLTSTGEPGRFTLTVTDVAARTIYFSNIGGSKTGTIPTAAFVDEFPFLFDGEPNAALSMRLSGHQEETVIVALLSGSHDPGARTLTYDVRVLENSDSPGLAGFSGSGTPEALPDRFEEAHLFIDDGGVLCVCCGPTGVEYLGEPLCSSCADVSTASFECSCCRARDPGTCPSAC